VVTEQDVVYAEIVKQLGQNPELWKSVERKKKRKKNLVVDKSVENGAFKGVAKKSVVCVSRLELGTSSDTILSFFRIQRCKC